ncbi:M23 family metallopeptidase [Novosphingobium piscinae]|uniref:M23 family metallopeptidase n=2 Tax=Novosphingobium piscinae TaxID=1507448 RepID=A0A7X1G1K1_9SPHN|nr:M23 family metallopeptidase [Novosphingobium piscinae]MBC2670876.1 M23 family metallopeptidase [Novosphingobium piscinae]
MRSEGQVRFIRISGQAQRRAAAGAVLFACAWVVTLGWAGISSLLASWHHSDLLDREAKVASAESRVAAYRKDIGKVADDIARRQTFIETLVQTHVGDLPADRRRGETVSDSRGEAGRTVDKVSAAVPEAAPLARLEARQLAFVEGLTRLADRRSASAEAAIRKLGLDPRAMLAALNDRTAQGGPLLRLATAADGTLDPRFRRLGYSLARMEALQRGLQGIPQVLPASFQFISSGFGYRADPIDGGAAFHPGLDFRGPIGAPIYAAAQGRVSFVGRKAGYGNCVEITHGNGLVTRYAHMSGFRTVLGRTVAAGDLIGAIGSTGRSTGPHLHFEVRIHDQPVNPRPFLEVAPHVLKEARGPLRGGQP